MNTTRDQLLAARHQILQAVESRRRLSRLNPNAYTMRHIQRAVWIARRFGLVDPAVLVTAGFRSEPR